MSKSKPAVPTIFGRQAVAYTTLSLISLFCVIPFVWLFLASFDGNASLFLRWPSSWTLNNYIGIFLREGAPDGSSTRLSLSGRLPSSS